MPGIMYNDKILDEQNVTSTVSSDEVEIAFTSNAAIQVIWTSTTAAASFVVEVSNDKENWVAEGASQAIANDSGNAMILLNDCFYRYIRVRLVYTSGTVLTAVVHINGKNA